ncbi:MAG: glycosyl hydrolase-related protein [Acidimicrobiales bacterium]
MEGDVLLVSHTHWDREWYRTFEAFRARLVDTVDRVLDQLAEDPEWRFLLDGQTIVLEDYLVVRPSRRDQLVAAVSSGRLAVGPWYVQPDSLLPSGESHVRNLLEGRRVAESFGGVSTVAYAPDSFGHPAQFPQVFAGFGLSPFVYWRGNGDEIDRLGPVYRWEAPDGSAVLTYTLLRGYFSAAGLQPDPDVAAEGLEGVLRSIGPVERAPLVLMNGVDHAYPQPHTGAVAAALAGRTGREVRRGVLDDVVGAVDPHDRPTFRGELLGGRLANLLPGVWSSRLGLKLANRRAERALFGWAEPWAALGTALGLPDESPSLRAARRALLANQAHDSIGGCSQDEVHRQMSGRFATAVELSEQTTERVLQRLAGLGPDRRMPWDLEFDVAVFNPSPVARTDVLRFPLDGSPLFRIAYDSVDVHPLSLAAGTVAGYEADGRPVRVVRSDDPARIRMVEDLPALDLELLVEDVPGFGWRRVHLAPAPAEEDDVDDGTTISNRILEVSAAGDGTLTLVSGDRRVSGLAGIQDVGDRGDTYDFDPVDDDPGAVLRTVTVERRRHVSGIQRLVVTRTFDVPDSVALQRDRRVSDSVLLTVRVEARVAPSVDRIDLHVETDNPARDHRMRLLFPTGAPIESFLAATTFDVATRTNVPPPATGWWHPPPDAFPHQGWVSANGLTVGAPGLPEAEVTEEGVIAVTLLRAVGWLSHLELRRRPIPAGPTLVAPDAQCPDGMKADLTIRLDPDGLHDPGATAARALADELGLRAVPAGTDPLLPVGTELVHLEPASVVLSALKPAEDGDGMILRLLNPTDAEVDATVHLGLPNEVVSVRLDETADDRSFERRGSRLSITIGPHALRTLRLRPEG